MKSTKMTPMVQLDRLRDICVDVSKSKLNVYFELGDHSFDDELAQYDPADREETPRVSAPGNSARLKGLRVICEPSGGYQDKLLQTARRLGHLTAYVNGEAVAKFRVVETNDNGKTDLKDPHIMNTLAQLNKTLRRRDLPEEYQLLRKCGVLYDRADRATVAVRGRLHRHPGAGKTHRDRSRRRGTICCLFSPAAGLGAPPRAFSIAASKASERGSISSRARSCLQRKNPKV